MGLFCTNISGGSQPEMPSYGEGMREALEAQTALLTGTKVGEADFSDFEGGLQKLVQDYEAPLRQTTAQIDTDVLRQTLLGNQQEFQVTQDPETGKFGIPDTTVEESVGNGRFQLIQLSDTKSLPYEGQAKRDYGDYYTSPVYAIIDEESGGIQKVGGEKYVVMEGSGKIRKITGQASNLNYYISDEEYDSVADAGYDLDSSLRGATTELQKLQGTIDDSGGDLDAAATKFKFENPYTGEALEEGQTITVREGDGMIDLLGDKQLTADGRKPGFDAQNNFLGLSALAEDIQAGNLSRQRERDLADVERLSGRFQDVMEDYKPGTAEAVTGARDVLESQRQNLTGQRAATAEDVAAGNATEVGEMISTGRGLVNAPTTDTFAGAATPATMTAATLGEGPTLTADTTYDATTAADPMALTAPTSYDPSAGVTGEGFTATAGLEGGQIQADPLREALMAQAQAGLTEGLTDREARQIAEAARARSTMMGRTFDQSGAIAEAQARVLEDRNRLNQNRAFAQQILGQEAGLQESDLSRGLQAAMQNQSALNRAAEFGAGQDMQAQLANQAATNQALQAGMAAGLSQEALGAQQQQAREFANMQAQNRASEFGTQAGMQQDLAQAGIQQERNALQAQLDQQGAAFNAEATQQAALADQRQKQQAAQFGVGAEMDAERLNAQLAQQGALGYVDAATRLAALEDQTTLDPFSALLNRAGGGSLGQAGQVFGQANYGLSSGPQYLNPESGLGYISQMAANEASMYGAQQAANASRGAGLMSGLGAIGGGLAQGAGAAGSFGALFCWVAREVYGPMNPQWMHFRDWMFAESPRWFFNLYRRFGERFANWISDKPRIKSIIRKWMDSKIGDK